MMLMMMITTLVYVVSLNSNIHLTCWLIESRTEDGTQPGSEDDECEDDSSVSSVFKRDAFDHQAFIKNPSVSLCDRDEPLPYIVVGFYYCEVKKEGQLAGNIIIIIVVFFSNC